MNSKTKKVLLWLLDLGINIAIIFGLVVIIQTWIIAPFDVSGASMCDTLNNIHGQCEKGYGEKIIINEAVYAFGDPQRGDIVVFNVNHGEEGTEDKFFIKRVIGMPGETVDIRGGWVYITKPGESKSVRLEEFYLNKTNRGNTVAYFDDFTVFEVPEDRYFLLGDNRIASTDSRSCFKGAISQDCKDNPEEAFGNIEDIRGKAWLVWWPISSVRVIDKTYYPELEEGPENQDDNSESLEEK